MDFSVIITKVAYYILLFITITYGFYFFVTGLFAFKKNKKKRNNKDYKNKFAVIIAARNEETVIANLVKSLKNQTYDKDRFEINVVINNCTDNTEKEASESGANIINCQIPVKSKGDVLKYTFTQFKDRKDIDAYAIFDADNVVHPDFLKKMNDSLNNEYKVAQGFRDSKNAQDNWISGGYALFYYFQNFFFNKARKAINLSASINGTGFVIKKTLIDEKGFNTKTLTEDVEFTGLCAISGEKIDYVEEAITYDEQPTKFSDSWKQRKRWSAGNLQCFFGYKKQLIKHLFKDKNLSCLDMLFNYMSPIVQTLSFVLCFVLIVCNYIGLKLDDIIVIILNKKILLTIIPYLVNIVLSIFISIIYKKKITDITFGILLFPLFIFTWIPINCICLVKKNITWEPIKHNRDINIAKLLSK